VRATAAALADAAAAVPDDGWDHLVTWTTGQQTTADVIVRSRLIEVLIHHVDLGLAFGPADWAGATAAAWPHRGRGRCRSCRVFI